MDMSINLTLVVQVVNFLIAYVIVSHFFLKPGYKAVRLDEDRLRHIKSQITAREELIAHKQEHKHARWALFQDYFYRQKPDLHEELKLAHSFKDGMAILPLTKQELSRMSKEIAKHIKGKI